MNNTLFPDVDLTPAAWTGPPPEIVTVQSLLYASLTTSLFAAFLAMLGKQWVNRYLRNRGGSAADKSRDRQRKLGGLEKWHFHLTIESLPVMLQFALLLLGCALSRYLWTSCRTVAGIIAGVTLFGVASYVFLTLAATLYYNCPYQTPPSALARALVRYLTCDNDTFARSLRSLVTPLRSVKNLRPVLSRLCAGVRSVLENSGCIPGAPKETEHVLLALVTSPSPTRIFEDASVDWEVLKADICCISWVLSSTTDADVIYSTVRFAADIIWYPEVAGGLSAHTLADLFFDCPLDEQMVPGKSERASSIGMALASVLSTQLTMEPENQALRGLCQRICKHLEWVPSSDPTFMLVVSTLVSIADTPTHVSRLPSENLGLFWSIPDNLSTMQKLWLIRIVLQTLWRWRRVQESTRALGLRAMGPICNSFAVDNGKTLATIKMSCFLTMAICLGLRICAHDLYAPDHG